MNRLVMANPSPTPAKFNRAERTLQKSSAAARAPESVTLTRHSRTAKPNPSPLFWHSNFRDTRPEVWTRAQCHCAAEGVFRTLQWSPKYDSSRPHWLCKWEVSPLSKNCLGVYFTGRPDTQPAVTSLDVRAVLITGTLGPLHRATPSDRGREAAVSLFSLMERHLV